MDSKFCISVSFVSILLLNLQLSQASLTFWGPQNPLPGVRAPVGSLWPRPATQNSLTNVFTVDIDVFQISLLDSHHQPTTCEALDWALGHYTQLIRNLKQSVASETYGGISTLEIELAQCPPTFAPDELELYDLSIKSNGTPAHISAILKAQVPLGVIRGLETFYQLLWSPYEPEIPGAFTPIYVNETEVIDSARFSHRGLMLDTSRHYLPEQTIIRVLTAMMYNKFNVFHWHIVDDQSFPYVSRKFPELSEKGAYNEAAVYTPEAVQRIIEAAKDRGIRVVFEFDTPGHVNGFGMSHQELLTPCFGDGVHPGTPGHPNHAAYENFDPSNEQVYDFMKELFSEIVSNVSVDPFIHVGMDEVYPPCWKSSPLIKAFMQQHNYTTYGQVQEHYTLRHIDMVKGLGVTPISWQDPLDDGVVLDKDVVVQVWKSPWQTAWRNALNKGHKVLLSACWYINYINYGESWKAYYECDPIRGANVNETQAEQVMGGEACIWGEFVDQTNVVPRLFPFASAVAEVLWTDREEKDRTEDAMWRLDQFRCSLLRRGIPAQPILNGHCGAFEATVEL